VVEDRLSPDGEIDDANQEEASSTSEPSSSPAPSTNNFGKVPEKLSISVDSGIAPVLRDDSTPPVSTGRRLTIEKVDVATSTNEQGPDLDYFISDVRSIPEEEFRNFTDEVIKPFILRP
jgi:hypothetical protein